MDIVTFLHQLLIRGRIFLISYKLVELQVYKTLDRFYLYHLNVFDSSLDCPEIPGNVV